MLIIIERIINSDLNRLGHIASGIARTQTQDCLMPKILLYKVLKLATHEIPLTDLFSSLSVLNKLEPKNKKSDFI